VPVSEWQTGYLPPSLSWNTEVTEKAKAGVKWCENASHYLKQHGGKEWKYLLIPHDEVKDNKRSWILSGLKKQTVGDSADRKLIMSACVCHRE